MQSDIDDAALDYLLAAALAEMAERVRKPRGRMAEPALVYGFAEEDLA